MEFLDPANSDIPADGVSTNPTVRLTALADPGAVTIEARVTADGEECVRTHTFYVGGIKLKSVTFGGPLHAITQDTGTAYPSSNQWLDDDLDGDATDMDGDRRIPIAYSRGSTVVISEVRFAVEPPDADLGDVPVRGFGPHGQEFEAMATLQGGRLVATAISSSLPLAPRVWFYNSYSIHWFLAIDDASEESQPFGVSDNRVYVTLGDPVHTPVFETVMDIAVRNASGLLDTDSVVSAIYSDFTDRSVRRKAADGENKPDGAVMQYWTELDSGLDASICFAMEGMIH